MLGSARFDSIHFFVCFVSGYFLFRVIVALADMRFSPSYPRWEYPTSKTALLRRAFFCAFMCLWSAWLAL